jgi:hypothetical protein
MHKNKHNKLIIEAHEALDKFLADHRESDGSGYAPFTQEDEENFWSLTIAIREAKFDPDADGDRPMQVKLLNRTRHEPMHFIAQPYLFKLTTVEEVADYISVANTNVQIAAESLRIASFALKDVLKEKE